MLNNRSDVMEDLQKRILKLYEVGKKEGENTPAGAAIRDFSIAMGMPDITANTNLPPPTTEEPAPPSQTNLMHRHDSSHCRNDSITSDHTLTVSIATTQRAASSAMLHNHLYDNDGITQIPVRHASNHPFYGGTAGCENPDSPLLSNTLASRIKNGVDASCPACKFLTAKITTRMKPEGFWCCCCWHSTKANQSDDIEVKIPSFSTRQQEELVQDYIGLHKLLVEFCGDTTTTQIGEM